MAFVDDSPLYVSKDNLLTTMETWGPKYVISLEIFVHSWLDGYYNIIQIDGNKLTMGTDNRGNRIKIFARMNNSYQTFYINGIESGKWISVLISQTLHEVCID